MRVVADRAFVYPSVMGLNEMCRIGEMSKTDGGAVIPGKEDDRRDAIARALFINCAAVRLFDRHMSLPGLSVLSVTKSTTSVKGLSTIK